MTTLITYKPNDGPATRRCDAKCYNAKGSQCKCVCAGINHGVGPNQAIDKTREHTEPIRYKMEAGEFIINHATYQLFPPA